MNVSTSTPIPNTKIRIFVSSVQKELEPERLAIASLITTDPFLLEHCDPVLFDKEPISGKKASKPYLDCLDICTVYLLLINKEYGRLQGDLSATHHEYRHAQTRKMSTLVFVKWVVDDTREDKTREFFEEIKEDGYTYSDRKREKYSVHSEKTGIMTLMESTDNLPIFLRNLPMCGWIFPIDLKKIYHKPVFSACRKSGIVS